MEIRSSKNEIMAMVNNIGKNLIEKSGIESASEDKKYS